MASVKGNLARKHQQVKKRAPQLEIKSQRGVIRIEINIHFWLNVCYMW